MKNITWKRITHVLSCMVEKYNNTYHRFDQVARNPAKYQHVHNAHYANVNAQTDTSPKFRVGNKVHLRNDFIQLDTLGKPVQATFYEQGLQLSVQEISRFERVLKKRKNQVFVKWNGYSDAFNSWVPLADLENEYQ